MAISLNGTSDYGTINNGAGTMEWAHVVGTGDNKMLVVGFGAGYSGGTENTLSASLNGTSLTLIKEQNGGATYPKSAMWYYANPPAGTGTINIIVGGTTSIQGKSAGGVVLNDVGGYGTSVGTNTSGTSPYIEINTAGINTWIVDVFSIGFSGGTVPQLTPGLNQTENWDRYFDPRQTASSRKENITGTTSMSWDYTGGTNISPSIIAASFNPAGIPNTNGMPIGLLLALTYSTASPEVARKIFTRLMMGYGF